MKINNLQDATVLVIDDNPINLDVLCDYLSTMGVKVLVKIDGESGIETAMRKQPDIIILDILMPVMDGYETCRRLKSEPTTQAIPVIFASALNETIDKLKGFEVGGVDYISKPFAVEEVLARLENCVKLHRQINEKRKISSQNREEKIAFYQLSEREIKILQLYASGSTRSEMAEKIYLSENSIKWYLKELFIKLNVKNRAQAIEKAREIGLMDL